MTAVVENVLYPLPDPTVVLPALGYQISPAGQAESDRMVALDPAQLFHRLVRDQESDAAVLTSLRLIETFLGAAPDGSHDRTELATELATAQGELADIIDTFAAVDGELRALVLRQRAPLALLDGCWLDMVSQPATQPSILVNRLYAEHFARQGGGVPARGREQRRRRLLESQDIGLPATGARDFLTAAGARPLTALHACWYLALSRLPANHLPEIVGVQHAFTTLGVDDRLLGLPAEPARPDLIATFVESADADGLNRFARAVRLTIALEREHVGMLAELVSWRQGLSLESRVSEVIARHARLAGRQHGRIAVGGRLLADAFTDPELDLNDFLESFRTSGFVQAGADGLSPFTTAMKFGGPMFGIFSEAEAAVFRDWVAASQRGERPTIEISPDRTGDSAARRWLDRLAQAAPIGVSITDPPPLDHRELFYRLVNIENFPNTLAAAADHVRQNLAEAEILFEHGADGYYTDASWFDYSPAALYERGERVYWDKLVNPYRPLEQIPDRDEVIFTYSTYALGYLIDGAWLHKLGNTGHLERDSDRMLLSIYADEMGHGDLVKNHITLTHRVLHSLGIDLPHIRTEAFQDQADLPDDLYGFSLHQLAMCLLPDTFYNEILGYNFAIEMFGSGELRLHEMQKLRHHGFDDCYEQAHLAIDNFSAGHTKQAADIIVSYLDGVRRTAGEDVVQQEWRRIWRGYASFALFVEHPLLKRLHNPRSPATSAPVEDPLADLLI